MTKKELKALENRMNFYFDECEFWEREAKNFKNCDESREEAKIWAKEYFDKFTALSVAIQMLGNNDYLNYWAKK